MIPDVRATHRVLLGKVYFQLKSSSFVTTFVGGLVRLGYGWDLEIY